jgi:hypothetical protein
MRSYPGSGYVLSVEQVYPIMRDNLSPTEMDVYLHAISDFEFDGALEIVQAVFEKLNLPAPTSYLHFSEEDDVNDDLERHLLYYYFDEDDLFKRVPTLEHEKLIEMGVKPQCSSWSQFG